MKTSLVSTAASQTIKADAPQQLKSVTVYFRGRKMVLMQRPQRRLSLLLCRMLRRSMLNLLGRLPAKLAAPVKKVLSAGALCAMALASVTTAHATGTVDTLPVNTLPTNPAVVYGTVGIGTNGSQMNVDIGTNKAIINWGSFSIGSQAGVDFHFDNATSTSSVLNRVIGNDPSKIMGSLTSNGKVFLINSAGILVGKTAKIDVAGFVASTLNITNSDFLAGKMSFHDQHRHHRPAGDVVIEEDGSIKTKEGGSVYLIGANVENGGVITSPKGEVLLAAGHSVDLVDTGTPGVKINVTGKHGKITNLGKIIAETGTIGFGAALINNSGVINASSVDKIGGRIFLRASKDLTTTATSSINADGTTGGNVILYSDDSANIDGDVSAVGNVDGKGGNGGYVETSGKKKLTVMYAPRVGKGGEWYIDPYNVIIVADAQGVPQNAQADFSVDNDQHGVITANGTSSTIHVGTILTQLNGGTNVTISTGTVNDGGTEAGNITVNSDANITKTAGGAATLKLDAIGNITISSGAKIVDGVGGLGLTLNAGGAIENDGTITMLDGNMLATGTAFTNVGVITLGSGTTTLNAGYNTSNGTATGQILNSGTFTMGSGSVQANGGAIINTGTMKLKGNTLTAINDITNSANGTIAGTGTINLGTHTLNNNAGFSGSGGIVIGADDNTTGTLNVVGNFTQGVNGVLQVKVGRGADGQGTLESDKLTVTGDVNLNGKLKVVGQLQGDNTTHYAPVAGDKIAVLSYKGTRISNSAFSGQAGLGTMFANYLLPMTGTDHNIGAGYGTAGSNYFSGADGTLDWSDAHNWSAGSVPIASSSVYLDAGAGTDITHLAVATAIQNLTIASGKLTTDANLSVSSDTSLNGTLEVGSGLTFTSNTLHVAANNTAEIGGSGNATVLQHSFIDGHLNIDEAVTANLNGFVDVSGLLSIGGSSIVSLDSLSGEGTLSIGDTANVTAITTCVTSGIGSLTMTGGLLNVNSDFAANDLTISAGHIITDASVAFQVGNSLTQSGGTITINGYGSITQSSGDLVLGMIDGTGNLDLTARYGAISQSENATLKANSVNATAGNGITLTNAGNNVTSSFSAVNQGDGSTNGDINFKNDGTGALTIGRLSNSSVDGNITIVTGGALTTSGDYSLSTDGEFSLTSAGSMTLRNYGGVSGRDIILTTSAGNDGGDIQFDNGLYAGNQIKMISAGSIRDSVDGESRGHIMASSVDATAKNGSISLLSDNNSIGAFTGSATKGTGEDGSITVFSTGEMSVGNVTTSNGDIQFVISAGVGTDNQGGDEGGDQGGDWGKADLTLNGKLTATGGNVTLSSDGAILQTRDNGVGIVANGLDVTAANGITLNAGNNAVSAFTANNSDSGDIVFINTSTGTATGKLVTGLLTNNGVSQGDAPGGNISVDNTGAMDVNGAVNAPNGTVSLVTHSPLNINGSVNANGNINFSAGNINNATINDNIVVTGVVTTAAGVVRMTAGNQVTLNSVVHGPSGFNFNITAHNVVTNVPQQVQPDVTTTAGPITVVTPPTLPVVNNTTVDQNVASTTNNVNNVNDATTPVTTTPTTLNSASNQTTGGGDGEFGGSKDDGKSKNEKSNKPLPLCT